MNENSTLKYNNIMITINNTFSGAGYTYTNENNCIASGEYKRENEILATVSINGQYTKEDKTYNFWANRDQTGNVNVSGVPYDVLPDVASEVATIISEIEGVKSKK